MCAHAALLLALFNQPQNRKSKRELPEKEAAADATRRDVSHGGPHRNIVRTTLAAVALRAHHRPTHQTHGRRATLVTCH